jgi:hypothetical protein
MGFKSREKKRKAKAAGKVKQKNAKASGVSSQKWWLTVVRSKSCCAVCGGILHPGGEMVFRKAPMALLCVPCDSEDRAA